MQISIRALLSAGNLLAIRTEFHLVNERRKQPGPLRHKAWVQLLTPWAKVIEASQVSSEDLTPKTTPLASPLASELRSAGKVSFAPDFSLKCKQQ